MTDHDAPTAQLPPEPPPPPAPGRPRLTRSTDDKVALGVAGGVARHLGIDPVLVRVAFCLFALVGGLGVLVYVVLALVVPGAEGADGPSTGALSTGAIVVLILLGLATLPFVGGGLVFFAPGIAFVVLVAVVCVLLIRAMRGEDASAGRILLALLAVAGSCVLGVAAAVGVAFGGGTIVAIVAVGLGVALVVAGVLGGARWLVLPALAVAIPATIVAASGLDLRGGVGDRTVTPSTQASIRSEYRLGVGRLSIDLREVEFRGVQDLRVELGMGQIEVLVPRTVCVQTTGGSDIGDVELFGGHTSGVDARVDEVPEPKRGRPVLRIRGDVSMGQLYVAHERVGDRVGNEPFRNDDRVTRQRACQG